MEARPVNKFMIDIETLLPEGNLVFVHPTRSEPFYYNDPGSITVENCSSWYNDKCFRKLFKAVMLPRREFIRRRGKRMLIKKVSEQVVQVSF